MTQYNTFLSRALVLCILIQQTVSLCPEASNQQDIADVATTITCKRDLDRAGCMNRANLCAEHLTKYNDCELEMSVLYQVAFPTLSCNEVARDEVFCGTSYGQIVKSFCASSNCPNNPGDFLSLFNTLGACGYLSQVGGAQIDDEAERVSCIQSRGACLLESPETLMRFNTCPTLVKNLLVEGAREINLTAIVPSAASCFSRIGDQVTCDQSFGTLVSDRYCGGSFWEDNMIAVIGASGAFGLVASGALYVRYRRTPRSFGDIPEFDEYGYGGPPGFQSMNSKDWGMGYPGPPMDVPEAVPASGSNFFQRFTARSAAIPASPMQDPRMTAPSSFTRNVPPSLPPRKGGIGPPPGLGKAPKKLRVGRPTDSMMV